VSDLDLTEAVEAAARAASEHSAFVGNARPNDGMTMWDSLRPEVQHLLRELVLPLVAAAAPFVAAQSASDEAYERLSNLLHLTLDERNERDATIERVRALLGDRNGPLWAVRGVREADIRTALEPRCTCSGITSQHGVDQNFGPNKVWRCDECDRIWEPAS